MLSGLEATLQNVAQRFPIEQIELHVLEHYLDRHQLRDRDGKVKPIAVSQQATFQHFKAAILMRARESFALSTLLRDFLVPSRLR